MQRTDEKGRFALVILEEADFHLVVEAQGYSPHIHAGAGWSRDSSP